MLSQLLGLDRVNYKIQSRDWSAEYSRLLLKVICSIPYNIVLLYFNNNLIRMFYT